MIIENCDAFDDVYNGVTADGIEAITSALKLSDYEHEQLERHKKLSQLADEDAVYTIRKNVHYLWLVDEFFNDAQKWLSIKSKKYDKRKKYSEKDSYDYIMGKLKEFFQVNTLEIIALSYEGYEQYLRQITFTTDSDYIFYMTIPVIENITTDNLELVNYGKIGLGYYSLEHCMNTYGLSYNVKELKPIMDEILTSEGCKKHWSKKELIGKKENYDG